MKFVDVYRRRPFGCLIASCRRLLATNLWTDGRPSDRRSDGPVDGTAAVRATDTVGLDQPPYTPVALRPSGESPNYQRRPRARVAAR